MPKKKPTDRQKQRDRHLYLCKVAKELCDWLDSRIEPRDGCTIKRMAEDMWEREEDNHPLFTTSIGSGSTTAPTLTVTGGS